MTSVNRLAAFILAILILQSAFATDRPAPPTGFTWQEIPELKTAFLKPDGWFFKRDEKKGTLAYFITKEDIDKNGRFQTGLTVNLFRLKQDSAVERGQGMVEQIAGKHHAQSWSKQVGAFQEFGCQIEDTDASGAIVMQVLAAANPKTNTLYLLLFESPEQEWDSAWKTGKQIIEGLALNDEI